MHVETTPDAVPMEVQIGPAPLLDVVLVDPVQRWLEDESDPAMDTETQRSRVRRLQSEYPSVWQRHSLDSTYPPASEVSSALREMGGLLPDMGVEDQPTVNLVPSVQPGDTLVQPQQHTLPGGGGGNKEPSSLNLSLRVQPHRGSMGLPSAQGAKLRPQIPLDMILGASERDQARGHSHSRHRRTDPGGGHNECPPETLPGPALTERQRPWSEG